MERVNRYPQLSRYFRTTQELADAGCMSRTRAWQCLYGIKDFTENEKRAIWNAIIVKQNHLECSGDFDKQFRRLTA